MLAGAAALFALVKWARLPLSTPGYQGMPVMGLLVWLSLRLPGRSATPVAATLASAALWLTNPALAPKALALVLVASVYRLAAGDAPSRARLIGAAAFAYGLWPLAAAAMVNGQGLFALCAAHAGFGAIGAGVALLATRLGRRSRLAEPAA